MSKPRVAFFTDSFHEVNGVALTSREFARFAQENGLPFLSVHAGPKTVAWTEGTFDTLELANSRAVLELDTNLNFDLLFLRHYFRVKRAVKAFRPDLVHITGPGHLGLLGAMAARRLGIPMAASWHTNLHEFASRRLERVLAGWSPGVRGALGQAAECSALAITAHFYKRARVLFAPNPEIVELLAAKTRRPTSLMTRGIDTRLFSPEHRGRTDSDFVIGYVGRLSPEKNVRLLGAIEQRLRSAGMTAYRFVVVGDGSEQQWLSENLKHVELPGTLRGLALARAYANMDAFVFPSETDTFGNVVVEASASGVPALVTNAGGPKYLVDEGSTGFVAADVDGFVKPLLQLWRNPEMRRTMSFNAREAARKRSWSAVFERVYREYDRAFATGVLAPSKLSYAAASGT